MWISELHIPLFDLLNLLVLVLIAGLPMIIVVCIIATLDVICGHSDDCPAAHGTDLDLKKPSAKACLMKNMLAIRYLHDFFARCLIEGLQADAAVEIL